MIPGVEIITCPQLPLATPVARLHLAALAHDRLHGIKATKVFLGPDIRAELESDQVLLMMLNVKTKEEAKRPNTLFGMRLLPQTEPGITIQ